jgi:polyisoprenoid-binding protein YceI
MSRVLALLAVWFVPASAAAQSAARDSIVYDLTPALTRLEVLTGKAGLLGFAGHAHLIRARAFSGRIVFYPGQPAASHVSVSVTTDSLEVVTPPDTEEIRKVTAAMREDVLDVAHYPEITLVSRAVERAGDTLRVQAALTMKGRTRTVPLTVRVMIEPDTLRASTTFTVNQTDFGIRPYRGGPGGTVRVADRVTFTIEAVAMRRR